MKLIDILVERLPALGGWPIDSDDERTLISSLPGVSWGLNGGGYYAFRGPNDSITYQQYESALVASKLEWDGEGLPPAGTRCEFISNDTSWGEVDVIGIDGDKVVFKPSGNTYYGIAPSQRQIFRPIRSEADKKKYATIEEMLSTFFGAPPVDEPNENDRVAMAELYDAIKSGKIVID